MAYVERSISWSLTLPILRRLSCQLIHGSDTLSNGALLLDLFRERNGVRTLRSNVISPAASAVEEDLLSTVVLKERYHLSATTRRMRYVLRLVINGRVRNEGRTQDLRLRGRFLPRGKVLLRLQFNFLNSMLRSRQFDRLARRSTHRRSRHNKASARALANSCFIVVFRYFRSGLFRPLPALNFRLQRFRFTYRRQRRVNCLRGIFLLTLNGRRRIIKGQYRNVVQDTDRCSATLGAVHVVIRRSVGHVEDSTRRRVPWRSICICVCYVYTSDLALMTNAVVHLARRRKRVTRHQLPLLHRNINFQNGQRNILTLHVNRSFDRVHRNIIRHRASCKRFQLFQLLLLILNYTLLNSPFVLLLLMRFIRYFRFEDPYVGRQISTALAQDRVANSVKSRIRQIRLTIGESFRTHNRRSSN